jgi:hypothetical protein
VDEHLNLLFSILILIPYSFCLLAVSLGFRLVHYASVGLLWEYLMRAKRALAAAAYDGVDSTPIDKLRCGNFLNDA